MTDYYVCLDNIRSLFNIGAILRTCSFFGISKVILLGYTGKNKDKQGKVVLHKEILKTSLGSEKDVNLIFMETIENLKKFAADRRLNILSFEQAKESIPLNKWQPKSGSILVFGNEVEGVRQEILNISSEIVEIERLGKHNSLNVEVTCGIALSKLLKLEN